MGRKPGPYGWLTPSEQAVMAARVRAGATLREVAAEFDVGHVTVWRAVNVVALARRRVDHSPWRLSFGQRE